MGTVDLTSAPTYHRASEEDALIRAHIAEAGGGVDEPVVDGTSLTWLLCGRRSSACAVTAAAFVPAPRTSRKISGWPSFALSGSIPITCCHRRNQSRAPALAIYPTGTVLSRPGFGSRQQRPSQATLFGDNPIELRQQC